MKNSNILLKNANIFDGKKDSSTLFNCDILIRENKIAKIGQNLDEKDAEVVDCKDKFIIPGLINLHVHLPANGKAPFKNGNTKKLVKLITSVKPLENIGISLGKKYCQDDLRSGVTSLRGVGGVADFDTRLRDKINSGKVEGPRLFVSDFAIGVPGGHMDGTVSVPAHSIEEAIELVHKLDKQKVDLIKIMVTGGVLDASETGEPGVLRMPKEYVKAVCDEAHRLGYKVAAHAESNDGVRVAIQNGVDTIEHGAEIPDDLAKEMKEKNDVLVCTLSPAVPLALLDSEKSGCDDVCQNNTYIVLSKILSGVKSAHKLGVPVGLGTDTGSPFVTHYNFYRELVWYKNIFGVSNAFALHTATLLNAQILGKDSEIGSLEEGKMADLVIFDKNPLDDLNNLKKPVSVMKDGKFIKNLKIKKNAYLDSCLDELMDVDVEKLMNDKFSKKA